MATSFTRFSLNSTATAIAIILPEEQSSDIDALRSIHDKAYRKWPPHINILYPCVHPEQLPNALARMREALKELQTPVSIHTDRVGSFAHRRNATIFLQPSEESEAAISDIRSELVKALGLSDRAGTHDGVFRPHMTIGQSSLIEKTMEYLVAKVEKLRGLRWENMSLAVLQRKSSGEMEIIEELRLGETTEVERTPYPTPGLSDPVWTPCFQFCATNGWEHIENSADTVSKESWAISVLSYNLMADTFGCAFVDRLPLITEAIKNVSRSTNQVLCLQEISDQILKDLLNNEFIRERYPYSSHSIGSLLANHLNLVTFSTQPFSFSSHLFAERHKSALVIRPQSMALEIVNIHLTAGLRDDKVAEKQRQFASLTSFLDMNAKRSGRSPIIAGDFNMTTSAKTMETALLNNEITFPTSVTLRGIIDPDIWSDASTFSKASVTDEADHGEDGATFDVQINPLAAQYTTSLDKRPQRYDRILFRKHSPFEVQQFERFGFANADGKCGSDHFGIAAEFKLVASTAQKSLPVSSSTVGNIPIVHDDTDVVPLLAPFLPNILDYDQRTTAISRLTKILVTDARLTDITIAPLGSYAMDTFFPDSDIDVLVIGSLAPSVFFNIATLRLKSLGDALKGLHYINSLVPVIEVEIGGIKFDVQYCHAAELLAKMQNRPLDEAISDNEVLRSLHPAALRPLNTCRDTFHLLTTIPNLPTFRTTHRFLSLYLRNRGLYSAKFGYLGGIHLSLLLNHLIKRLDHTTNITPASLIRIFLIYYSTFPWTSEIVFDPQHPNTEYTRSLREPIVILAIHSPSARLNVAGSCTKLSAATLSREFGLAASRAESGEWQWFLRPPSETLEDFLGEYTAFIKIAIDMWDLPSFAPALQRNFLGAVESKIPIIMVGLGRIEGMYGRAWPMRLRSRKDEVEEGQQFKGYYLVGVSAPKDGDEVERKLVSGKVVQVARDFEKVVREVRGFDGRFVWVDVGVVRGKKVLELELEIEM